ncbi:MAG: FABP family protein [Propionibacteriaceae bacterium]|nr:FABP family protein [Propionibacteriaceae bacterium]
MAFEIPADLNPALVGLAWLRGRWEGTGYRQWPGLEKHSYALQVDFADNGEDYLHYLCQAFETDEDGAPTKPLFMETGFWRPLADGTVDVMMCSPDGFAEIWFGKVQPGRLDLITDAVARTKDAKVSYTAGRRLYGNVEGRLLFSFDRATEDEELQPYLWAQLERA